MSLKKLTLALIVALHGINLTGQIIIVGHAPQFVAKKFSIWKEEDFLSRKRFIAQETKVNTKGKFRFELPACPVQKYYIGTDEIFGCLYVENGAFYRIEFFSDNPQNSSYNLKEEIELTFIDLDSNDINYKIIKFENKLDKELTELYLDKRNDGELLRKITISKYKILKKA